MHTLFFTLKSEMPRRVSPLNDATFRILTRNDKREKLEVKYINPVKGKFFGLLTLLTDISERVTGNRDREKGRDMQQRSSGMVLEPATAGVALKCRANLVHYFNHYFMLGSQTFSCYGGLPKMNAHKKHLLPCSVSLL